jgi:hypothetical protein
MVRGNLSLNGVGYKIVPFEYNGQTRLVHRYKVEPLVPGFSEGGPNKLQNLRNVIPLTFPNFMDGFGRDRIDSDSAFVGAEYRRCYYATCDIRWARQQYLPILEANSTQSGLEVIRASESYKGNLWSIWDDGTSTALSSRKYDGSSTAWSGGGTVEGALTVDATSSGTGSAGTTLTVAHTCGTGTDRLLVVSVSVSDDSTVSETTIPTGVTYNSVAMTKLDGNTVNISGSGGDQIGSSIWHLVAPTTGTNNIVATFGSSMSDMALGGLSFTGADQGSAPMRTAGSAGNDNASSVSEATTSIAGDIVVDALAVFTEGGDISATGGGSPTVIYNTRNQDVRGAMSRKTATGTSTTMSWTLGGDTGVVLTTGAVKQRVVVGLDSLAHKTHLLTLSAVNDSHSIKRSTDGATFIDPTTDVTQGLLTDIVTVHEDIDAGLLATVGNEAVAVLWHESNGTITFFSSTNAGDVWADETIDIASGNGPQGVAVMNGIDNAQKLYVGTREGLYEVDTSPSTWTADLIFPMTPNNDNCRRMAVGQDGALWFAQGVDNNSAPIVYNMFTHNGTRQFMKSPNDFSDGDGLPEERLGPIRRMIPVQGMMYVAAGGGKVGLTTGHKASIFVHNGRGWSSMRAHGTQNQPIEWIAASGDDDGVPRLHYAVRADTDDSNAKFLKQAFVNPVTGVEPDRELSGFIDMPYVDAGILTSGTWASVRVNAEDLSPTNSNEFINVDFGEDDGSGGLNARGNTDLGDFLSGTSIIKFGSSAGIASINMGLRVNLIRDSGTVTETPKLKDVQILVKKKTTNTQGFIVMVDLQGTADLLETTTEAVITQIEAARDLGTFPAFQYANMTSTFVDIIGVDWGDDIDNEGDSDEETVPDTNARRQGTVIIRVEEPA